MTRRHLLTVVTLTLAAASVALLAQAPAPSSSSFTEDKLGGFTYRALGPYRAGSWIADIAVPEAPLKSHLYTFYVGVRYGGVWKTTNNGTTFQPVFDGQDVTGIGCLAIAPSNENVVWVGTGDASSVRVTYPGDGVYKSIDAGKSWQRMGLQRHPADRPYRHPPDESRHRLRCGDGAACGRPARNAASSRRLTAAGPGRRCSTSTTRPGAIDLVINRRQPDTLYAAMYDVQRRPWKLLENGVNSGIHKTTDGGKTWTKLAGGLPTTPQGRIGLDIYQKNPNILYAVTENFGKRPPTEDEAEARPRAQDRTAAAQHRRRGLPDRRRREDLAEDERGHRRHELRRPGIPSTRSASTRTTTSGSSSTAIPS